MERIFLKMVCVSASSSGLREENGHGKEGVVMSLSRLRGDGP